MKSWQSHFKPTVAKHSVSSIFHCFVAFVTWKHGADIKRCHNKSPWIHKPKNFIETSLWQAWVAWIQRGQQILGTENLRRKKSRIHHWFTTQTWTLLMFELDCDSPLNNSPLPTLWCFHELNVFAIALLLNKRRLWGLCVQSSTVKRSAHMNLNSFVWYTARFPDMINSGRLSVRVEANQVHAMSSWFLSNCVRILLRNENKWIYELGFASTKCIGVVQIIFQPQLLFYKLDTSIIWCSVMVSTSDVPKKQIGDMANLAAWRHRWWEGTIELWKAHFSEW